MKKNIILFSLLSLGLLGCFEKKKETASNEQVQTPQPLVEEKAVQKNTGLPPGHPPISSPHGAMGGMDNPHGEMGAISGIKPTPKVPEEVVKLYPGAALAFVDKATQKEIKEVKMKVGDKVEVNGYTVKLVYVIPDLKVGENGEYFVASLNPINPAVWLEIYKDGKLIFRGPVFANFPTLTDPGTGFIVLVKAIMTTKQKTASTWNTACASCHGTAAPSKEVLLSKYKTKEEFIKAAKLAVKRGKMPPNLPFEKAANELYSKSK